MGYSPAGTDVCAQKPLATTSHAATTESCEPRLVLPAPDPSIYVGFIGEKKWGKEAVAAGFTVFPNILLSEQHALGIDCYHLVIILQIHKHWWRVESAPLPSQVQLAKTMNTDRSTVKRKLNELRELGFVTWTERKTKLGGQASNSYDLSGLIKHVQKYAKDELAERAKQVDANKARRFRKRPSLRLVHDQDSVDE